MPEKDEEFELIPLSPLRRLEKRVTELESESGVDIKEFFHELVDIISMNQQLVDQLAKANDSLRIELSRLPGRIEELVNNVGELLSYIKAAAVEETTGQVGISSESLKPLTEKMDKLVDLNKKIVDNNETLTNLLETMDRKMRAPIASFRKPMPQPVSRPQLVKET